jgi:hypothetical protein
MKSPGQMTGAKLRWVTSECAAIQPERSTGVKRKPRPAARLTGAFRERDGATRHAPKIKPTAQRESIGRGERAAMKSPGQGGSTGAKLKEKIVATVADVSRHGSSDYWHSLLGLTVSAVPSSDTRHWL